MLFFGLFMLARALGRWPALKEWTIIAFSLIVLASWGLFSLGLFLTVAGMNFVAVRVATQVKAFKRTIIVGAIAFDLGVLGFFKYADFFTSNVDRIFPFHISLPEFGIPLAISFYTFHLISYLVDDAKQRVHELPGRKYLFYLTFFPHLIAGPIVRTWQLAPQLGKTRRVPGDLAFGIHFFVVGFFLKAVVGNNLAQAMDPLWEANPPFALTVADHWATAMLYYAQIYSDFAGYSLMALGMARVLGYRLPPNFRAPLLAGTVQDFWRRWHRTLSFWLRDYLYIPLGGGRRGDVRAAINAFITMLLGGLWHGAGWTFVVWGAMHGAALGAERLLGLRGRRLCFWQRSSWWLCTQLWVTVAWVFFRAPNLEDASTFLQGMFGVDGFASLAIHDYLFVPLLIALGAVLHQLTPLWITRVPRRHLGIYLGAATAVLLLVDIVVYSPNKVFIYFKF